MAARKKTLNKKEPLPLFCDFNCPHADFSKDVAGDCRREQAVWCRLIGKHNNKNNRCLATEISRTPP